MILITHIAIALFSLIYTAYLYLRPSAAKLYTSYALVALTVGTGTWLIIANPAHMVQSCIMGITYLCVAFFGIAMAKGKLAAEHEKIEK